MKHACIIGSGFGGLALAIRLQSAGITTTVVEARDKPGGMAYYWEKDGFTFDAGPTVITDPECIRDLWRISGRDIAADIELMPVNPFYRLNWMDGTQFDYSNDDAVLRREIARIAPEDVAGYEEFLHYCADVYKEGYVRMATTPFLDAQSMLRTAPAFARHQAWRSVYTIVSSYIANDKLRQALSFQTLMTGGNPNTTSAIHNLTHTMEQESGIWWAKGGTNRLIAAMVRHFERLGGTIRLGDPAVQIHTVGDRVSEVETQSGLRERFDAVASNADIMHSYRTLLSGTARGQKMAKKLSKKRFSPSAFIVHFALDGTWPGIPHHMVLFGPRYGEWLSDIYDHGVLPQDFSIYLHHPTVTDPSMAPQGKSTFYAMIPVAHLGKLPIDWAEIGPMLEKRVLDEVGRRLIPDIHERILTKFHYTPVDFANDLNAYHGSGYSLEPIVSQSAWLRAHNRDNAIGNFYLVGAGTHPGAGIPGVISGAKATATLMLEDLR